MNTYTPKEYGVERRKLEPVSADYVAFVRVQLDPAVAPA